MCAERRERVAVPKPDVRGKEQTQDAEKRPDQDEKKRSVVPIVFVSHGLKIPRIAHFCCFADFLIFDTLVPITLTPKNVASALAISHVVSGFFKTILSPDLIVS
jgi:hypothetical protein